MKTKSFSKKKKKNDSFLKIHLSKKQKESHESKQKNEHNKGYFSIRDSRNMNEQDIFGTYKNSQKNNNDKNSSN